MFCFDCDNNLFCFLSQNSFSLFVVTKNTFFDFLKKIVEFNFDENVFLTKFLKFRKRKKHKKSPAGHKFHLQKSY